MSHIIINDQWYDCDALEEVKAGGLYLSAITANDVDECNQILSHPITPIPAPVWAKLGMEVLAFVPKERQCDIINFGMEPDGCKTAEFIAYDGVRGVRDDVAGVPYYPVVWLSPKKTTEELLADIVTLHDNMATVVDIEKMTAAIKAAKQHLQQNK